MPGPAHGQFAFPLRPLSLAAMLGCALTGCGDDEPEQAAATSFGSGLHYVTDVAVIVPDSLARTPIPSHLASRIADIPTRSPSGRLAAILEVNIGEDGNPTDNYLGVEAVLIDQTSGRAVERARLGRFIDPTATRYREEPDEGLFDAIWGLFGLGDDEPDAPSADDARSLAASLAERLNGRFLTPLGLDLVPSREVRVVTQSELAAAARRQRQPQTSDRERRDRPAGAGGPAAGDGDAGAAGFFGSGPVARQAAGSASDRSPRPAEAALPPASPRSSRAAAPTGSADMISGPSPDEAGAAVYFGFYSNLLDAELFLETARARNERALAGTTTVIRRSDNPETGPRFRLFALTRTPDEARLRCEALQAVGTDCQGVQWPVQ